MFYIEYFIYLCIVKLNIKYIWKKESPKCRPKSSAVCSA